MWSVLEGKEELKHLAKRSFKSCETCVLMPISVPHRGTCDSALLDISFLLCKMRGLLSREMAKHICISTLSETRNEQRSKQRKKTSTVINAR